MGAENKQVACRKGLLIVAVTVTVMQEYTARNEAEVRGLCLARVRQANNLVSFANFSPCRLSKATGNAYGGPSHDPHIIKPAAVCLLAQQQQQEEEQQQKRLEQQYARSPWQI